MNYMFIDKFHVDRSWKHNFELKQHNHCVFLNDKLYRGYFKKLEITYMYMVLKI